MKTFAAVKAMVSGQLLDSDVISHCLCVQSLHMSQWPGKEGFLALRSFIFLWHHHFFLFFFFFWNRMAFTVPGTTSCWHHCIFKVFTAYVQGPMSLLCPSGLGLFLNGVVTVFVSVFSLPRLSVHILYFPFLYLPSAFLHLFLLIPSLFSMYFLSWCTLLDFSSNWHIFCRACRFCNHLVKDTYAHAYSHVLCPSPSTHSSVLYASPLLSCISRVRLCVTP